MKRYNTYKDSEVEWIGEIPEHWKTSKIKYLGNIGSGDSLDSNKIEPERGEEDYPVFGGNGILGYFSNYNRENPILIIGRVGEKCGNVHYSSKKVFVNDNSLIFDPISYTSNLYYLFHCLTQRDLNVLRNKNTQPLITGTLVKNESIPLPPLPEQQAIVNYLDEKTGLIDDLIKKKQEKIQLLKEKRTALINHVVTKGLDPEVKMKDSGIEWIGEIPERWLKRKLGHIVNIQGRIGFKGYKKTDFVDEGEGCLVIGGKHIDAFNKINLTNPDYLHWDKYYESPEIMVKQGDLILSQRGTLGKVLFIDDDYGELTINPSLVLVNKIQENPKYLWYYLQSFSILTQIDLFSSITTIPMLSQDVISGFQIILPPLSEQQQIVTYLDEQTQVIDQTIQQEEQKIELLKEYRQSLISEVVTGKICVLET